jgi:hypothetical protein
MGQTWDPPSRHKDRSNNKLFRSAENLTVRNSSGGRVLGTGQIFTHGEVNKPTWDPPLRHKDRSNNKLLGPPGT